MLGGAWAQGAGAQGEVVVISEEADGGAVDTGEAWHRTREEPAAGYARRFGAWAPAGS